MDKKVMLYGPELVPENPELAIVFLHGYGSDGEDLIQMAEPIRKLLPKYAESIAFFSPYAPAPTPYNMGYQWFEYEDIFRDKAGLETSANLVWDYVKNLSEEHKLPLDKIFVFGFSQGTMTALYGATHWPKPVGGVIGFSGRLLLADEVQSTAQKMPIVLIHGEEDDVVPVDDSKIAAQKLTALGYDVELHLRPRLMHSIDVEGLDAAIGFVAAHTK